MFLQVQVVLDESKSFKLVARLHTDNTTGLVHQQVITLDESVDKTFVMLLHPNMLEFTGVTAEASAELVDKALADKAAAAIVDAEVVAPAEGATIEA